MIGVMALLLRQEPFDIGMDTCSAVADAYFDKAPFVFEGTLKQLHFRSCRTSAQLSNDRPTTIERMCPSDPYERSRSFQNTTNNNQTNR